MIGNNIRYWAKKRGFSNKELAEKANMSYQNLYNIYQKDHLDVRLLQKFSELLRVPFLIY